MHQFSSTDTPAEPVANDFCVHSDRVQYVHFANIPANARGACQLEFTFPAGYSVAGSQQINVWKTGEPIVESDTWSTAPKPTTLFGTVTLKSDPKSAKTIIVNSGACEGMKDFKFTVANNAVGGAVQYLQQYPGGNTTTAAAVAGMRISYGC
jgi:hypothetical protein